MIDEPKEIRQGEELDKSTLETYIKENLPELTGAVNILQFPSGFSNLTYLVSIGDKEYVLRKPPHGANIKSAHDMEREFRVISAIKPHYSRVPTPLIYCNNESIIGSEFYMMERVKGTILRQTPPKGIELTPSIMQKLSEATVDNLAEIHKIDIQKSGLIEIGKPEGYVKRQVEGWISRYKNAETDESAGMKLAEEWMLANLPKENAPSLIHNDYKYDNVVLNPTNFSEIKAVLDWEMATVGDPLMDLGTTLAYWAEKDTPPALKSFSLTSLEGNLSRQQVIERYSEHTGANIDDAVFYFVYGTYKVAVICQQIYARFKKGLTKDKRFGMLIFLVQACAENAENAIKYKRVNEFR
jgi:aminoglycoside phosphotransferase (APT) family kinase protein